MKNLRFQLTLDIDLELQNNEEEKDVRRRIISSIEDHFYDKILHSDDTGSLKIKATNYLNKTAQTQAERVTPSANITAYFSSDGPAFTTYITHYFDGMTRSGLAKIMSSVFSDINAALREAHHRYITKLHED